MGLTKIHGFLHEKQQLKPSFGNITVMETVLVETDDPHDSVVDLIGLLPASPVTPSATNPYGISFTLYVSTHPSGSGLVLYSAGTVQQSEQGACFWEIPLEYKTDLVQEFSGPGNNNPRRRKDQREKNPLIRPVVWNGSSQTAQKQTYTQPDGTVIRHTNNLLLSEPQTYSEEHEIHTFSFNIAASAYNWSDFRPYIGKVSSSTAFGVTGQKVKLKSCTASEEYEDVDLTGDGTSRTLYHYMRVTITFEINPSGWVDDAIVYSMSTLQLVAGQYYPIDINSRGDWATAPWPLVDDGTAWQYDSPTITEWAELDTGYPLLADIGALVTSLGLVIP